MAAAEVEAEELAREDAAAIAEQPSLETIAPGNTIDQRAALNRDIEEAPLCTTILASTACVGSEDRLSLTPPTTPRTTSASSTAASAPDATSMVATPMNLRPSLEVEAEEIAVKAAAAPGPTAAGKVGGRTWALNLGEARELLKAFKASLDDPDVQKTLKSLEQRGGMNLKKGKPMLIASLWNPALEAHDFPQTDEGYKQMTLGIQQHGWNTHVRESAHEVERLGRMPEGSYFGIPLPGQSGNAASPTVEPTTPSPLAASPGPYDAEVLVRHAINDMQIKILVPRTATYLDVRTAIACHTGRNDIFEAGRLVRRKDGKYASYNDQDSLGETRTVCVLGVDLTIAERKGNIDLQAKEEQKKSDAEEAAAQRLAEEERRKKEAEDKARKEAEIRAEAELAEKRTE